MPRHAHRVDANQAQIVRELKQAGVQVRVVSGAGMGIPDLLVYYGGHGDAERDLPGRRLSFSRVHSLARLAPTLTTRTFLLSLVANGTGTLIHFRGMGRRPLVIV